MIKVTDLSLDDQKKRNLILKELIKLGGMSGLAGRTQEILARKQVLMAQYIALMKITPADKAAWEEWIRKIEDAKREQRKVWEEQRWKRKPT